MLKRLVILSLFICFLSEVSISQIPGLTFTGKKEHSALYLKTKTVWITATPFFFVQREFSPDQGSTYINVGMFGKNVRPYIQNDSIALRNLKTYKLTRIFGIAQMWVIAPLLSYKHFTTEPGVVSTGDENIDNSTLLEEESGYLTAAIIVFCTGTLTYHVLAKGYLFDTLERYNYILGNKLDLDDVSFNMNIKLDHISQTPQISLVWTF
jgi:hypothetical protein